jgi:hypothetical protein
MGFEEEPDYNYLINLLKKSKKAAINKETVLVNDSLEASTEADTMESRSNSANKSGLERWV